MMDMNIDLSDLLDVKRVEWVFLDATTTPFDRFAERVGRFDGVSLVTNDSYAVSYVQSNDKPGYSLNSRKIDFNGIQHSHTPNHGRHFATKMDAERAAYNDGALQFMIDPNKVVI